LCWSWISSYTKCNRSLSSML